MTDPLVGIRPEIDSHTPREGVFTSSFSPLVPLSLFFSLSPFGSTSSFLFDLPPELSRLDTPSLFLFFSLDASTSDHWLSRPSRFAQSVCPTNGWSVRANDPTDRLVSRTARERNKEFAVHIWNTCLQRSFEYSLLVLFEDRNLRDTV